MLTNLSLLPHDNTIIIKDIAKKSRYIQLMKDLLQEFQQALFSFINNEKKCFDAQVGETLCQIRAYKIYLLSTKFSSSFRSSLLSLNDKLIKIISSLDSYKSQYLLFLKHPKKARPDYTFISISLSDFFSSMQSTLSISEDALFIFLSFFLHKYQLVDKDNIPVEINFNAIANRFNLSTNYSQKLGKFYQKMLSELSCKFIFALLNELPDQDHLKLILPWLHRKSDEGRMVLPCYLVTEILILHMINNDASVVLLIDIQEGSHKERIAFYLQGSQDDQNFKLVTPSKEEVSAPCIVFYGTCHTHSNFYKEEYINRLRSLNLKEIILYNNSTHPQYSGATLYEFRIDPFQALITEQQERLSPFEINIAQKLSNELLKMKNLASYYGCMDTNQSLFFLKHIFCDTQETYADFCSSSFDVFNRNVSHDQSLQKDDC